MIQERIKKGKIENIYKEEIQREGEVHKLTKFEKDATKMTFGEMTGRLNVVTPQVCPTCNCIKRGNTLKMIHPLS
jgi:hypothetical protein